MRTESLVVVWLTALLLAALAFARSAECQVITPGGPENPVRKPVQIPEAESSHSTSTRELVKRFQRGRQLLKDENFAEGSRLLQSVVENDEDVFFYSDQDHGKAEHSLKSEAQSLLGKMPPEGRAQYERQHGPVARRMLDAALQSHDAESLALVARHYFHTQAGYEAAYHLAGEHLDHDRPLTAALGFERLLAAPQVGGQTDPKVQAGAATQFEPYLSLKCALSWLRAGRADRAQDVLVGLRGRYPRKTVTIAGRSTPLFDEPSQALSWLTTTVGTVGATSLEIPNQWTCVGGNLRRNAVAGGGSPYLNRGWRASTVNGATGKTETDAKVVAAFDTMRSASAAASDEDNSTGAPATSQPLIVDNLVIARSIGDVRAYDIATGNLAWATSEKDQMLLDMLRFGNGPQAQVPGGSPVALLLANRCLEDTTFGTLSSDGEFVFAIEDLEMSFVNMQMLRLQVRDSNRLVAYDAKTGRAVWESGGSRTASDPLSGTHFLGVPLVLDRRLYCLGEAGSEIRLLVLDPRTGRLDWSQTLSTAPPQPFDSSRRQTGLSPSSFGDVLVCPLGPDQMVALSLSQRSLLWRYSFKEPGELYDPNRPVFQPRFMSPGMAMSGPSRWLDSQAAIEDLRVVVTPTDASELYCLNLLDGTLAWKKPRGEGLFVAGIHHGKVLVVGRSYVQALKLSDGEPAWQEPTSVPLPSGRGFVAGENLYLPLMTAEVATISLRDGRIVARARSAAGNVPANLVAIHGFVVSQGADFVEAYRQLDALETEIAGTLAQNPDETQALAMRGEIRLQRGKVAEAYADLKRALELKSDDATVDATIKSLLAGSLLEGLRVDYNSYRQLEPDIERLLTSPQERATYLWLRALGLRRAGEPRAALTTLLEYSAPGVADHELERIDGTLKVRRDRLVRARTAELYDATPLGERAEIDRSFRQRVEKLREDHDVAGIRRFVRYFGGSPENGEIENLAAELPFDETDWLEDEIRLEGLCHSKNPQTAALAAARLTQLMLLAERPRDALVCLERVERDWPEIVSIDGKTGHALVAEWRKKDEITREIQLEAPWPQGLVEVERLGAVSGAQAAARTFEIPLVGDRRPFFSDSIVQIGSNWREFSARDSMGRQLWKLMLDGSTGPTNTAFNRAYTCGHLLLVSMGTHLLAMDLLGKPDEPGPRLLWRTNLVAPVNRALPNQRWGMMPRRRMPFNQVSEQTATIGPVTREQVTLLSGRRLSALDPLTGKPLWIREGVTPGTELFGDSEYLYAIAPETDEAVVYNALDGSLLGNRPLPAARLRFDFVGRHIVTWRTQKGRQILALFDPWTGKDLWSRDFEDTAQLALVELDEAAVLEISGKLTVLSLADGKVRFETTAEPEPQVRQIHVIRSRENYVLIANQATGAWPGWQQVAPQVIPVHGRVHGYNRQNGKHLWTTQVDRQGIDLHQPANLPVLTFVCHLTQLKKNTPGLESNYGLTCLDKRNGRLVFDNRNLDETLLFVEYAADVDLKQLELRLFRSVLRLTFTDKPFPAE